MIMRFIMIIIILLFSLLMWCLTALYKKKNGIPVDAEINLFEYAKQKRAQKKGIDFTDKKEKHEDSKAKKALKEYLDEKPNDNYRIRPKWILEHDQNERKNRGQQDSM